MSNGKLSEEEMDRLLASKDPATIQHLLEMVDLHVEGLKERNPAAFFVPNGRIEEFVRAVGADQSKHTFILPAANGVGKTSGTVLCMVNLFYGPQSEWFNFERFRNWPYPKKFWYVSEQTTLKEVVVGVEENSNSEFRKWMPRGRYRLTKSGMDFYSQLTTDTGWSGSFKTYDMDVTKFESDTIGVLVFDEPPPRAIYNACVARLRKGGIIIMPMTPLYAAAWVKDELVDKAGPGSDIYVLYADIEDNCIEHGTRGILRHEDIKRMLANYDPDEIEARAHGQFMHLSGLVLRGLDPSKHRHSGEPGEFDQGDYRIFNVWDPHDARPPMLAWFGVDKTRRIWVVDEFPDQSEFPPFHEIKSWKLTTKQVAEEIKRREKLADWDPHKIVRVMDPNFGRQRRESVGKTVQQFVYDIGRRLHYPLRYSTNVVDDLISGHQTLREWIRLTPDGDTLFRVAMRCRNIWTDLTHYTYVPRTGRRVEVDGPGEHVGEKYKDGVDVCRYLCMYMKGPKPAPAQEEERPEHYAMYGDEPDIDWRNAHEV